MGTILLGLGSAILGGFLSWYLQRWRTPDRSAEEIAALRGQVSDFQKQIQALEQERTESAHFPLEVTLEQTAQANYVSVVKNDSDYEVTIEAIKIIRNDAEICITRSTSAEDWTIAPHSAKRINWSPLPDPASTLRMIEMNLAQSNVVPIRIILVCRIRGKVLSLPFSKLVAVALGRDRLITPF